ncbi:MAG: hypothetical protein F4W68_01540 [Cenarchaeum sp. SB0661_bin_35]|nr:hypothetical protein [Cenarchaeum sp. SB0667_bin_13]MXZ93462.1 hypothetical protein [Cenarchaeum sp. SB0666_bin_15]MYB46277.1 hypothetical protein [Cenarchaeum sp. SB0662_bin_33]MYC79174.1 hypothetical protein [Cenarchaeum sp. SB0661_bin_35]MYD59027.1 hypothetical protein [Cenarchaeum sp. SB0678_bin_8]
MLADNETYRQTESEMNTSRSHEPTPDHSTLVRHMQTIPPDWLNIILAETARRCLPRPERQPRHTDTLVWGPPKTVYAIALPAGDVIYYQWDLRTSLC